MDKTLHKRIGALFVVFMLVFWGSMIFNLRFVESDYSVSFLFIVRTLIMYIQVGLCSLIVNWGIATDNDTEKFCHVVFWPLTFFVNFAIVTRKLIDSCKHETRD